MKLSRTALAALAALGAVVRPKLAQDAKMPDLAPALVGLTAANQKSTRAAVAASVRSRLAQDIDLSAEELGEVIAAAADGVEDDAAPARDSAPKPPAVDADGDRVAQIMAFLDGKLSAEDMEAVRALAADAGQAQDEKPEADEKPADKKGKQAMDAALLKVREDALAEAQAIRIAEQDVAPFIGQVAPQRKAADVYRLAMDSMSISTKGVPESAFGAIVRALPKPGALPAQSTTPRAKMATDAADFTKRFPHAVEPGRS